MIFVELNEHSEQWTFYLKALLNFMEQSEQWTFYLWTFWTMDILFQSFVELYGHSEQCTFYFKALLNFMDILNNAHFISKLC